MGSIFESAELESEALAAVMLFQKAVGRRWIDGRRETAVCVAGGVAAGRLGATRSPESAVAAPRE